MEVNIKRIDGPWTLGYSLDRHKIRSIPIGPNEYGHMQFNTLRTEVGESLFQLKYRSDYAQVQHIAHQLYQSFSQVFDSAGLVIPMPPSKARQKQPVVEIAHEFARLKDIPCYENLLVKTKTTPPMKDLDNREEKVAMLMEAFSVYDVLGAGLYDVILIDDLFDTGSSIEAATNSLRKYSKIRHIYIATVTWK